MLVAMAGLGCTQMRYAGRYQEVKIESEPPGAMVLIEGNIGPLSPVAVKAEDGTELAYSSPMQLKTPVVVILDKENPEYHIKIAFEGYPEYEKVLKPRFAFHPYLIITFPVVPFWSKYEIQRFDDVFVDFEACKAQLEAGNLAAAEVKYKEMQKVYIQKSNGLDEVTGYLEERQKELAAADEKVEDLTGELTEAAQALEDASEEEAEEAKAKHDVLEKKLADAQKDQEELKASVEDLRKSSEQLADEKTTAQEAFESAHEAYQTLLKERNAKLIAQAEKQLQEAQAEFNEAEKAVEEIKAGLTEKQAEMESAGEVVFECKKKVMEAQHNLEKAEEEEKEAAAEALDNAKAQLQKAQDTRSELAAAMDKLEKQLASAEGEHAEAKSKLDTAKEEYAGLTKSEEEGEEEPENK
jgi:chromosome segregation ATPase